MADSTASVRRDRATVVAALTRMLGDTPADRCAAELLREAVEEGGAVAPAVTLRTAARRLEALAIEAKELADPQNPHSGARREREIAVVQP